MLSKKWWEKFFKIFKIRINDISSQCSYPNKDSKTLIKLHNVKLSKSSWREDKINRGYIQINLSKKCIGNAKNIPDDEDNGEMHLKSKLLIWKLLFSIVWSTCLLFYTLSSYLEFFVSTNFFVLASLTSFWDPFFFYK